MAKVLCAIIVLTLTGCISVFNDTFNSSKEFIPSKKIECDRSLVKEIEVFRSSLPSRKFIEVGIISVQYSTYETALAQTKKIAAYNCADAIVDLREAAVGVMNHLTATAVKFD